MSEASLEHLEAEKARSTIQLLFKAARLLNERAVGRARERTKAPLRTAHTSVLPHIGFEGTRLTELATRLGVTKQAAGQLVDELVELGHLERIPDPADARAKLIRFSKRGKAGILEGLAILQELETELTTIVGAEAMKTMHDALAKIVSHELVSEGSSSHRR
ncbi:MAG: MarR family transcriptional regulator [Labilithrix sp.]